MEESGSTRSTRHDSSRKQETVGSLQQEIGRLRQELTQERSEKMSLEQTASSLENALQFSKKKVNEQKETITRLESDVRKAQSLAPCLKEILSGMYRFLFGLLHVPSHANFALISNFDCLLSFRAALHGEGSRAEAGHPGTFGGARLGRRDVASRGHYVEQVAAADVVDGAGCLQLRFRSASLLLSDSSDSAQTLERELTALT